MNWPHAKPIALFTLVSVTLGCGLTPQDDLADADADAGLDAQDDLAIVSDLVDTSAPDSPTQPDTTGSYCPDSVVGSVRIESDDPRWTGRFPGPSPNVYWNPIEMELVDVSVDRLTLRFLGDPTASLTVLLPPLPVSNVRFDFPSTGTIVLVDHDSLNSGDVGAVPLIRIERQDGRLAFEGGAGLPGRFQGEGPDVDYEAESDACILRIPNWPTDCWPSRTAVPMPINTDDGVVQLMAGEPMSIRVDAQPLLAINDHFFRDDFGPEPKECAENWANGATYLLLPLAE